jgi:hypothetical protein
VQPTEVVFCAKTVTFLHLSAFTGKLLTANAPAMKVGWVTIVQNLVVLTIATSKAHALDQKTGKWLRVSANQVLQALHVSASVALQ